MVEKNNSNIFLTVVLAVIIFISAIVVLYVNLPKDGTKDDSVIVLTVIYGDTQIEYTINDLESMDTITGFGGYRTNRPIIGGQAIYTGVPVIKLVESTVGYISNYSLFVISNEEGLIENKTFNFTTIQGVIDIYNSTNASDDTPIEIGGVTMIVCYEKDGEYLDESDDGKIKIAFVNKDEEKITASNLWWKFVESIEIIES
jgi:hypothetical protein